MKKRNLLALGALVLGLVACGTDPGGSGGDDDDDDDTECGNDKCEEGETPKNCEEDCEDEGPTCGNKVCEAGETTASCAGDCPATGGICGNNVCEANEAQSCPADCAVCGNNKCEGNEASSCPADCDVEPVCGNQLCEGNEASTCPGDCPGSVRLQNNSSYYVYNFYVRPCANSTWGPDQTGSLYVAPGNAFTVTRVPAGCYYLRASTYNEQQYWQTPSPITIVPNVQYTWTLVN